MRIHIVGKDERLRVCAALLEEKPPDSQVSVMLLPIPVSRDGENITGTGKSFETVLGELEPGCAVVAYGAPKELRDIVLKKGGLLLDPECDAEYVLANAELTAVGALGRVLNE